MRVQELLENNQNIGWYVINKSGHPIDGPHASKKEAEEFRDSEEPGSLVRYGRPELYMGLPVIKQMNNPKESLEEAVGKWKIPNKSGVMKSFKSDSSKDAIAWAQSRGTDPMIWDGEKWIVDPKFVRKQALVAAKKAEAAAKVAAKEKSKVDLQAVYNKFIDVVGNSFPDGEPLDRMIPWFRKTYGIDYDIGRYIDQALKKHGSGSEKKGADAYLASMWDEMSADALHDAMQSIKKSGPRFESPFIQWDKSGNPHKAPNPWAVREGVADSSEIHKKLKQQKLRLRELTTNFHNMGYTFSEEERKQRAQEARDEIAKLEKQIESLKEDTRPIGPKIPNKRQTSPFEGGRKTTTVTKAHKPLIWENMLGTVVARKFDDLQSKLEPKYFDYKWDAAREYAGVDKCDDLRICKNTRRLQNYPAFGKVALWGIPRIESDQK